MRKIIMMLASSVIFMGYILFFECVNANTLNFYASEDVTGEYYVFFTTVGASEHSKIEFTKEAIKRGVNPISARETLFITPVASNGAGNYLGGSDYYDVTRVIIT